MMPQENIVRNCLIVLLLAALTLGAAPDATEKVSRNFASTLYKTDAIDPQLLNHIHDSIVAGDRDITRQEIIDILTNAKTQLKQLKPESQTELKTIRWQLTRVSFEKAKNIGGYFHTMGKFKPADQVFTLKPNFSDRLRDNLDAVNMYANRIILVIRAMNGTPKIVGFSADL